MTNIEKYLNCESVKKYENIPSEFTVTGGKTDSRDLCEGNIFFCISGNRSDGHDFIPDAVRKNCIPVVSQNYVNTGKFPVIYTDDVLKTLGEFANIWRSSFDTLVFAITGSNGKTTTKEILVNILSERFNTVGTKGNFNNFIGVPLTLFRIEEKTEMAVVEIGTNSEGEIRYLTEITDPDFGLITNIGDAHLEKLHDRKGVYLEKISLFEYIYSKGGKIILNTDDEYLKEWDRGNISCFGQRGSVNHRFDSIRLNSEGYPEFYFMGNFVSMKVKGMLNLKNALAAAAAATELGVSPEITAGVLSEYVPSSNRYETVKYKNSTVLLDCYNSNPTSVKEMINDLKLTEVRYLIVLGDMLELGEMSGKYHSEVIRHALNSGTEKLFLIGENMKEALQNGGMEDKNVYFFENFADLKTRFDEEAENGSEIAVKGSRAMKLEKLIRGNDYAEKD